MQFRKWATNIIEEFTIKAYVMDDERLKYGHVLTNKYFEEQLQRIREIRQKLDSLLRLSSVEVSI